MKSPASTRLISGGLHARHAVATSDETEQQLAGGIVNPTPQLAINNSVAWLDLREPMGSWGDRSSPWRLDCPASGVSRASARAPGGRRHAPV